MIYCPRHVARPILGSCPDCEMLQAQEYQGKHSAQALAVRLLLILSHTASWPCRVLWSWGYDAFQYLVGKTGYRIIVPLIGLYFGLYGIMEARHERTLNRSAFELSAFINLVTSNNRGAFVAAMKNFGPVQMIKVPPEPHLYPPWKFLHWWGTPIQPNKRPLFTWAQHSLPLCTPMLCGAPDKDDPENPYKGIRVDLSRANLNEAYLFDVKLDGADLSGADLSGADLSYASLVGANLGAVKLVATDLSDADLSGADLVATDLSDADLSGADLRGVHLSAANLRNANLSRANLSGVNFRGVYRLRDANLSRANLSGVNFRGVYLDGVNLSGANLSEADLRGAYLLRDTNNLSGFNLSEVNLHGANLSGINLRGAILSGANLEGAILSGANLEGAILSGANLEAQQLISIWWNEQTKWPKRFNPPCPRNNRKEPCKALHTP